MQDEDMTREWPVTDRDPQEARAMALDLHGALNDDAPMTHALLYVGDQVGELVTVTAAAAQDRHDDERQRLAMVLVGLIGVACVVGWTIVPSGWLFAALALVCALVVGGIAERRP